MTTNKYPNADTSPERLAQIKQHYVDKGGQLWLLDEEYLSDCCRDLLAMVQERDREVITQSEGWNKETFDRNVEINKALDEIKQLKQQLHDQRWRRREEEEPGLSQVVVVESEDPSRTDADRFITICFGVREIDEPWTWWFGLPPRGGDVK